MRIEITTAAYNQRRYSKPWITRVEFNAAAEAKYEFGTWVGRAGDEGLLVIEAEHGDIIARGQKDYRGRNTATDYYRVEADGTLTALDGKADAYRVFQAVRAAREQMAAMQAEPVDERAALLAEREALLARLAEINAALGDAVPAAPAPTPAPAPARRKARPAPAAALILLGQLPLFPALFGF